jgi:hypothetical protein
MSVTAKARGERYVYSARGRSASRLCLERASARRCANEVRWPPRRLPRATHSATGKRSLIETPTAAGWRSAVVVQQRLDGVGAGETGTRLVVLRECALGGYLLETARNAGALDALPALHSAGPEIARRSRRLILCQ